jgi:ABC-type antimicrobial peptide transport system permease subunit
MKLKLQQVILSLLGFLVVLMVSIYALNYVAKSLFPDAGIWIIYGLPELLGLILAVVAAVACWKYAGRQAAKEED